MSECKNVAPPSIIGEMEENSKRLEEIGTRVARLKRTLGADGNVEQAETAKPCNLFQEIIYQGNALAGVAQDLDTIDALLG